MIVKPHKGRGWPKGKKRGPISDEHRRKLSEATKGEKHPMWGKKRSDETKRKISIALSGKNNLRYGKPAWNKGIPCSNKTKRRMSESHKGEKNHNYGKHHSEETKVKIRAARLKQVFPVKDTSIEVAMQKELDRRSIVYDMHVPVCGVCQPDIVFPEKKMVIQCDGNYWHSPEFDNGRMWRKDRHQDKVLRESGWTVIRFWESEINDDVSHCVDIVEAALGCFRRF